MPWYSKQVGNGIAAFGPTSDVVGAFEVLAKSRGITKADAVFSAHDIAANAVTLYFSPTAGRMAIAFGASPCSKPMPTPELTLIVGEADSWATHFPGHSPGKPH